MNSVFLIGSLKYISDSKKNKSRFPKTTLGISQPEVVIGNQKFDKTFVFVDINKDNKELERLGIQNLKNKTILIEEGSLKSSDYNDMLYLNITSSSFNVCNSPQSPAQKISVSGFVETVGKESFILSVPKKRTPKTKNFDPYRIPIYLPQLHLGKMPKTRERVLISGFYAEIKEKKFIVAENIISYDRFKTS